ncbi:phosphonoacetate hydrolase [Deinococcus aerius]|uniref:Phosphonoacetate hydrolase n=1 Tax=Deinococcus aerius TaxID=200253 RepID=A0A2I9DW16_9DEIO|nr:alkaline phosphatase family protein [Deinococcus aerius]GBF04725.1 phosphonoacetate hydrolase [Deinococcus aerius]
MLIVACIDGLDPAYLAGLELPNFARVTPLGRHVTVSAAMPSVTNVNNCSLVTGRGPATHGVVGNFYRDEAGRDVYLELPDALLAPTIFERRPDLRGLALVAKDKLLRMIGRGASTAVTAERPPAALVRALGPVPPIYSAEVSVWLFSALCWYLEREHYDVVYLSTTDYVMHKHPPGSAEAGAFLRALDAQLGRVLDLCPGASVVVTADHGMNAKRMGVDLSRVLRRHGVDAQFVPAIKDRYVAHHDNLGGFGYLYLDHAHEARAADALRDTPGVEQVLSRAAARDLDLHAGRVGDLIVLAAPEVVFGEFPEERHPVEVRSHGSAHECRVPWWSNVAPVGDDTGRHHERLREIYEALPVTEARS